MPLYVDGVEVGATASASGLPDPATGDPGDTVVVGDGGEYDLATPARNASPGLTGALLILDPDDASSLTLASGRVAAIASQVGVLSMVQADTGKQPLLIPRGLNGRAIVHGTAARVDSLGVTDAALNVADPLLLMVARVTAYGAHSSLYAVSDEAPVYARWLLWAESSTGSDLRIDTETAPGTVVQRSGETWARWQVIAYRPATRQLYTDGLQTVDGADRTPTYPSPPYPHGISFAGQWAWCALYDGALALDGTTWDAWALAATAALASRFGLEVRP